MHRRDKFKGEKILHDKLFKRRDEGKITIVWDSTLDEVLGDASGVTGTRIKNVKTGSDAARSTLKGVFIAIGHQPNTAHLRRPAGHERRLHQGAVGQPGQCHGHQRAAACSPPAT